MFDGDTSRNGVLCTLTTTADRWGVQALASNLPQTRLRRSFLSTDYTYARLRLFIIDIRHSRETQNPSEAIQLPLPAPSSSSLSHFLLVTYVCLECVAE
jgi:hypothetical protein